MKELEPNSKRRAGAHRRKAENYAGILREHLPALHKTYGIKSLGLFGSYARGEEREGSDLDLLVEFNLVPDLFEFVALQRHLSELLGVKVDLVMKRALKPYIGERIIQEVVSI